MICFIALYYSNVHFDSSMIFSTMEVMLYLKIIYFLSLTGLSYLFELKVLFKRFADIYNMDNISMKRLDEATKQPVPEANRNSSLTANMSLSLEMINIEDRNNSVTGSPERNSVNLPTGEILFGNFNGYFSTTEFK